MVEVGRLLAKRDVVVVTGGFTGAGMEAPARGATEAGGKSVGYTILGITGNQFLTNTHDCSSLNGKPMMVEQQYGLRLGNLLEADGFIIAANGGPGTLVELFALINLKQKIWAGDKKRCAILRPLKASIVGWDYTMLEYFRQMGVIESGFEEYICVCETPKQAVKWATT